MPLYEYYCSDCRSKFELLVSHRHADDVVCVKCHGEKIRRLLSVFAMSGQGGEGDGYDDFDSSVGGGSCACGGGSCGCN